MIFQFCLHFCDFCAILILNTQNPNLPASTGQHEDQDPRTYGSGGGGLKQCAYCQSWTSNAQRMCASCRTRMLTPSEQFAAMRQAQLVKCKRIGCPNGASSNVGLCRNCEIKERQLQNARNTRGSANLKYSYY